MPHRIHAIEKSRADVPLPDFATLFPLHERPRDAVEHEPDAFARSVALTAWRAMQDVRETALELQAVSAVLTDLGLSLNLAADIARSLAPGLDARLAWSEHLRSELEFAGLTAFEPPHEDRLLALRKEILGDKPLPTFTSANGRAPVRNRGRVRPSTPPRASTVIKIGP